MGFAAWATIIILLLTLYVLTREMAPPDVVFLGATILLALLGILEPKDAFAGFADTAVLMVGALFIVAAGLRETGVIDFLGNRFLGNVKSETTAFLLMAGVAVTSSALLNNTTIVAMLLPVVIDWCRKRSVSPSRLLMALSFLTILGGTCTLIGTSTNLVVQGKLNESQQAAKKDGNDVRALELRPMTFVEIGYVGVPCAIVGTIYMLSFGRWLLPKRKEMMEQLGESRREYLVEMVVAPDCRLVGETVEAAGLRALPGLFLIEIDRAGTAIGPVAPREVIQAADRLVFTGIVSTIVDLKKIQGLVPATDATYEVSTRPQRGRVLCEAVISPTAPLIGKTIKSADFRAQYNAAVVAVHRNGERVTTKIGDIVLRPGDTLLLQTDPHFIRAHRNNPDFYLVSDVEDSRPLRHDRARIAIVLFVTLIGLMAFSDVLKVNATLLCFAAAGLMVVFRCLSTADARQSVDWPVLVSIAASFGLGTALQKSGAAEYLAKGMVSFTEPYGPIATLAALYFGTMLLNELITNNGAAALAFPFCLASAKLLDVSPRPFIMAITLAASFAFASPIGYQTHMMVYGPGGYRFMDFVKVGVPLNLLMMLVAVFMVPQIWPFEHATPADPAKMTVVAEMTPKAAAKEALSPEILHAFGNATNVTTVREATTVEAFRLSSLPAGTDEPEAGKMPRYPTTAGPIQLSGQLAQELAEALTAQNNYAWQEKLACDPTYGVLVVFARGDQKVEAYFCFECGLVTFVANGKVTEHANFNPARAKFVRLVQAAFPTDTVIQNLK